MNPRCDFEHKLKKSMNFLTIKLSSPKFTLDIGETPRLSSWVVLWYKNQSQHKEYFFLFFFDIPVLKHEPPSLDKTALTAWLLSYFQ